MVIVVEIVDPGVKKPFLGGWRDRRTGIEYLNASTQTLPRRGKASWDSLRTRDTQTKLFRDKGANNPLEKGSQTFENGVIIPSITDRFLACGKFESARFYRTREAFEAGMTRLQYLEAFAVKIQKFYRAYRTRSMIRHFASVFRNLVKTNEKFYRAFDGRHGNGRPLQIIRSTSPKTRDDFAMLYSLVDRWRIGEIERANRTFMRSSRLAAHAVILKKEIELLRTIDRIKTDVKRAQEERRNLDFLSQKARPIKWTGYKGCTVSMETLRVQKAQRHKRLYQQLSRPEFRPEERLSLLFELRQFLANHRCEAALEIVYIIDQEFCLIGKNVQDAMLQALRRRLSLAFLYLVKNEVYCENSKCCDSASPSSSPFNFPHSIKVDKNLTSRLCSRCEKLMPIVSFGLKRQQRISVCLSCESRAAKSSSIRVNQPYEEMLRRVRRQEAKCKAFDSVAFLIGPKGVQHLVDVIWHGKSGVSECGDINELALVRFQRDKSWAPWNSLVLTKREANVHANLEDPGKVYSKYLIEKFFKTNLQARLTFESLDIFSHHDHKQQRYTQLNQTTKKSSITNDKNHSINHPII